MDDLTKILQVTTTHDQLTGAVNTPIQLSATFAQTDFDNLGEFDYARSGNQTRLAAEKAVAALEHATHGYLFSSGMAAISSVLMTFSAGDHIVVTSHVYGGTFRVLTDVLSRFGITHTFVDCGELADVADAILPNTKAIYIETPSNPTLSVTDIAGIVAIAKAHDLLTIADNTFMSPALQKPLDFGVDIVVHSATKFLAGHSDIVAGAAVTKRDDLAEQIYFIQNAVGATLGVLDSWLLLRGMKTLGVRMAQASANATELAKWLAEQPQVDAVYYPGLSTHPNYQVQLTQAKNGGAVLSFDVGSIEHARQLVNHLTIPIYSVSLGGVESIISYPPKMSHAELSAAEQVASGITPGLLRYSVGLESITDIIADLANAFSYLGEE
ncbi:trans-sulfuration enzyme family protein [Weissella cibaria]|uniref:trans-sulfuration enzyme family protein n=1 Tax=Weissella cibaria TaxID=137591 RepID=UPI001FF56684|nr:aminotransferase class I/II-fold pyridoxal phosphate-dependent enzyme [Weissella cibaria]UOX37237.1 aminotransferase class V-fold PLP-dependent enzyme [Weissella cibaria]